MSSSKISGEEARAPGAPIKGWGELALMLAEGADPNVLCGTGKTPLMIAAGEDSLAAIELLLPLTDPNIVGISGITALLCAANRSPEVLRRLLPVSDPRAVDDCGHTALMMAAHAGCVENVAMLLPVSDVGACDDDGRNAMFFARRWGTCSPGLAAVAVSRESDSFRHAKLLAVRSRSPRKSI